MRLFEVTLAYVAMTEQSDCPCLWYNRAVDPITHTLIGVGMANAVFRRPVGKESVLIMALASNLPDVDALVHLTGDPTAVLFRRTFGHSLFMIPLWSFGLALIFRRFMPHIRLGTLYGLVILSAAVHVFFDLVNSFGVVLLWPMSDWRPELGILFIIDLALTGTLAAPLFVSIIRPARPYLVTLSRASFAMVVVYVTFCGANRILAEGVLASEVRLLNARPDFSYVFPEPFGPHRWHGVIRHGAVYENFLIYSLTGEVERRGEVRSEVDDPIVRRARGTPLARRLEWFFKAPVWGSEKKPLEDPDRLGPVIDVTVRDLRFNSLILNRDNPFVYRFEVYPNGGVDFEGGGGWNNVSDHPG
jgi:membrane-bound metal-dependent hydrolase YbcI (DUF457 family)